MNSTGKALFGVIMIILVGYGSAADADPPACPEPPKRQIRPGDPKLFDTIWTITMAKSHERNHKIDEHICIGDQLVFRRANPWEQEGQLYVLPGPRLADRWGLEQGASLEVKRTPGGRLCFSVDLRHGDRMESHVFFFRREIDSKDRIELFGRFGPGGQDHCTREPDDDPVHGGTLHAHDAYD